MPTSVGKGKWLGPLQGISEMTHVECGAQRPLTGSALQARTDSSLFSSGHPEERPLWAGAPRSSTGGAMRRRGRGWAELEAAFREEGWGRLRQAGESGVFLQRSGLGFRG